MAITIHNVSLLHYYDKRRCHNGLKKWTMVEKSGDEPFLSWSDMTTHTATTKYHHVRKNENAWTSKLFGCFSAFFAFVEWRCRFANFLLQWVFRILGRWFLQLQISETLFLLTIYQTEPRTSVVKSGEKYQSKNQFLSKFSSKFENYVLFCLKYIHTGCPGRF